jgi:hypothetical protein
MTTITLICILTALWEPYLKKYSDTIRLIERSAVKQAILCNNKKLGFKRDMCFRCDTPRTIYFSCKSSFCPYCGKIASKKFAAQFEERMLPVTHRHLVMGLPRRLWVIFHSSPYLQKKLMKTAFETVKETMCIFTKRDIVPGALIVIHVFGKDTKKNVHIHMIVTEGGIEKKTNEWVNFTYFPYEKKGNVWRTINMIWRDNVLAMWGKTIAATDGNRKFLESWVSRYPHGFYIYGPSKSRIKPTDGMQKRVKYITRYMKHPVISDSRIVGFDGSTVRFWYDKTLPNGKKKRVFVTMDALEFIHNVLCHIHEKNFRSAIPYGLYSNNNKLKVVSTTVQMRLNIYDGGPVLLSPKADFQERLGRCPKCHEPLYVVAYVFLDNLNSAN